MIELYFAPGACSFVPHVGLEAVKAATGEDFKPNLVRLHKGENKTPEYLANARPWIQFLPPGAECDGRRVRPQPHRPPATAHGPRAPRHFPVHGRRPRAARHV